jgi:hypothetical protein
MERGEQAQGAACLVVKERGVDTPAGSGSSSDGEEEGEITLPPLSSLRLASPPLSDIVSRQVVGAHKTPISHANMSSKYIK